MTVDRRVRRTRERLKQALTEELMSKALNEVTVMELAQTADINRGTFYLHYQDVYDLYQSMETEVIQQFHELIEQHVSGMGRMLPVITEAFNFLAENSATCLAIIRTNGKDFLQRLVTECRPKNAKEWYYFIGDDDRREYFYSFITTGCIGLMQAWLENGMRESPQEMSAMAGMMMERCVGKTVR